jgi:hypothetical protein
MAGRVEPLRISMGTVESRVERVRRQSAPVGLRRSGVNCAYYLSPARRGPGRRAASESKKRRNRRADCLMQGTGVSGSAA